MCSASTRGAPRSMSRIMEAAQRDCGSVRVRRACSAASGRGARPKPAATARVSAISAAATAAPSSVAMISPTVPRIRQVRAAPAASMHHFSQRSWRMSVDARAATGVAAKASASAWTGGVIRPERSPNRRVSVGLAWRMAPSSPSVAAM